MLLVNKFGSFVCYPTILSCWHSSSSLKIPRAEVDYPLVISKKPACTQFWKGSCLLFLLHFFCDLPHSSQGLHKMVTSHLLVSGDTAVCLRREGWPASVVCPITWLPWHRSGLIPKPGTIRVCLSLQLISQSREQSSRADKPPLVFYLRRFPSSPRELLGMHRKETNGARVIRSLGAISLLSGEVQCLPNSQEVQTSSHGTVAGTRVFRTKTVRAEGVQRWRKEDGGALKRATNWNGLYSYY